jgi:hypothetical protein
MAKSITRKGIAFAAAACMVSAGIASAPANAAGELTSRVTLVPADGNVADGFATLSGAGNAFYLQTQVASTLVDQGQVRLFVDDPDMVVFPVGYDDNNDFDFDSYGWEYSDGDEYMYSDYTSDDGLEAFWREDGVVTWASEDFRTLNPGAGTDPNTFFDFLGLGWDEDVSFTHVMLHLDENLDIDTDNGDDVERGYINAGFVDEVETVFTHLAYDDTEDVATLWVDDDTTLDGVIEGSLFDLTDDAVTSGDGTIFSNVYRVLSVDLAEGSVSFANGDLAAGGDVGKTALVANEVGYTHVGELQFEDGLDDTTNDEGLSEVLGYSNDAADFVFLGYRLEDADENSFFVVSSDKNYPADGYLGYEYTWGLATSTDDSVEVEVQAWIDEYNDGLIDSVEYASAVRTVEWVSADDVTASFDWSHVNLGDNTVSVDVTFSPALNLTADEVIYSDWYDGTFGVDYFAANFNWGFFNAADGDDFSNYEYVVDGNTVTLTADVDTTGGIAEGYVSVELFDNSDNEITTNRFRVQDAEVDAIEIVASTGDNVAQSDINLGVAVREETESVSLTVSVLDADEDPISGVNVEVTAVDGTLDADADLEVGGEAVDPDDATFDDVDFTTNSAGEVTIVITSAEGLAGDSITIKINAEGTSQDIVIDWEEAAFYAFPMNANDAGENDIIVTDFWLGEGNSTSKSYVMYDQFGVVPGSGEFRLYALVDQGDLDQVIKKANFNSGVATFSVSDEEESGEIVFVDVELQSFDSDTDTWSAAEIALDLASDALAFTTEADFETEFDFSHGDDDLVSTVFAVDQLEEASWFMGDSAIDLFDDVYEIGSAEPVNVYGDVSSVLDGAEFAGGDFTISGSDDLLFVGWDQDGDTFFVYSYGSFSGVLDADGDFDVAIYSNHAGEYEVTVTSGGTSETVDIEFEMHDYMVDDAIVTIDAPSNVMPGYTLQTTVTVTDEFGNPIATDDDYFSIEWDGPGLISGSTPAATNAAGEAKLNVFLGANETGSGTLTATYAGNDNATSETDDDVVAVKTITIGAVQKVNAGSFKGYVALYAKGYEGHRLSAKVGKDWVIVPSIPASVNDLYRHVEFVGPGVDIAVRMYIDRVLVDTINMTTK